MKAAGVTDYIKRDTQTISDGKMSKFNGKYFSNVHKIGGTHVQCMNDQSLCKV